MSMTTFPADNEHVRISGRSIRENNITYLSYTCSFAEFEFTGTYAEAEIITDRTPSEEIFRAWVCVFVNDEEAPAKRFSLDEKKAVYELYKSDKPEKVKIRIMKTSEAAFAKMGISEIRIDGELCPPPVPASERKIEFVGDSITCGYGIDGVWNVDQFSTETENPLKGYAYNTAKKCGAQFQYVSWSGMGILSSWVEDNVTEPLTNWLMTDIYPYTDSGLENTLGREGHENHEKWDFTKYVPQVIIFNLGTNDHSWTKDIPERQADFAEKYYRFLEMLRSFNPDAYIICTYGVMGTILCDTEQACVDRFKAEHDDRICYIALAEQDEADGIGADWHPSEKTHAKMAEIVSAKANEIFESMGL
ncbi:MAG: GDSL-type esterase/lipase family protein [Huintestinicola sp.]